MKEKMMIVMLLLGCVVISSLVTQMTARPVEAGYGEQETEYPWEYVKIYDKFGSFTYYGFNKSDGEFYETSDPYLPYWDAVIEEIRPTYQIIPNAKGGCYVMNPNTGDTWFITAKGVSKKVLTIQSSTNAAPNTGEDIGNE